MPITLVQTAPSTGSLQGTSSGANSPTFPSNTTVGNLLILGWGSQVTTGSAQTISTVSGGGVGTWRQAVGLVNGVQDAEIWWGVVTGTPGTVITITYASNLTNAGEAGAQEYSGARPSGAAGQQPDQTHTTSGSSATPGDTTSITNKGTGELCVIVVCDGSSNALDPTSGPTNGYTQDFRGQTTATGPLVVGGHLILDGQTQVDAGATWSTTLSQTFTAVRASFFPPAFRYSTTRLQAVNRAATF